MKGPVSATETPLILLMTTMKKIKVIAVRDIFCILQQRDVRRILKHKEIMLMPWYAQLEYDMTLLKKVTVDLSTWYNKAIGIGGPQKFNYWTK